MAVTLELSAEADTSDHVAMLLERVAKLIEEGYTSGFDTSYNWSLSGDDEPEDDDDDSEESEP